MVEPPRHEFIKVVSKVAGNATDDEIRRAGADLEPDEQKLIEAMLLARAGDLEGQERLLKECLNSDSPGIALVAKTMVQAPKDRRPPEPKIFEPDGDLDRVIGWIKWSVKQAPDFQIIDEGELFVSLHDFAIQVIEKDGKPLISKMIRINDKFMMQLASSFQDSADSKSGFGFSARNSETPSFCWEWFVVDQPGHANKLQEEGEVSYRMLETAEGFDMVETRFLKDLSFRIIRFGLDEPMSPHWRLEIAAGSEVTWPSLLDGKVVVNERAS